MNFDVVIGNPPYQIKTGANNSSPIYHLFQEVSDNISYSSSLVYPGEKWMKRTGQVVLDDFGRKQINSANLHSLLFYPNAQDVFGGSIDPEGGISVVFKSLHQDNEKRIQLVISKDGEYSILQVSPPGEKIMVLDENMIPIVESIRSLQEKKNSIGTSLYLDDVIKNIDDNYKIDSRFVERHIGSSELFLDADIDEKNIPNNFVSLITNESSGAAGRSRRFKVNPGIIPRHAQIFDKYCVLISSRHSAGSDGRSQMAMIVPPYTAFGGARMCVGAFQTQQEAENFFMWLSTDFVRALLYTSTNRRKNFGVNVPLPEGNNFTSTNDLFSSGNDALSINDKLCKEYHVTQEQKEYMASLVAGFGNFEPNSEII